MAVLLIAEDDVDVATVLERLFKRDGFTVFTAADGTTALQTARRERPDVVLTDMDMPGLTGLQLCRAIRADPVIRDVPVAILSGTLHHGDPGIAEASVCGLMVKPFAGGDLVATVRGLSERGRHDHRAVPSQCPLGAASD
jgi:DNA-binding response OmpR family regulator